MILDYLLFASSILALVGMPLLAFGYRASIRSEDIATRYFTWSMYFLAFAIFGRRMVWDILFPIANGGVTGNLHINIIFNLSACFATYLGLKSRLNLIPEEERDRWKWWNCWIHPSLCQIRGKSK